MAKKLAKNLAKIAIVKITRAVKITKRTEVLRIKKKSLKKLEI